MSRSLRTLANSCPVLSLLLFAGLACSTGVEMGPPRSTSVVTTVVVQGDAQTVRIGQPLSTAPSITVKDQAGKGMGGVSLTFTVSDGGGSLASGTAVTDAGGAARLPTWTLGSTPGMNTVTVTANGGANPTAQIHATARQTERHEGVTLAANSHIGLAARGFAEYQPQVGLERMIAVFNVAGHSAFEPYVRNVFYDKDSPWRRLQEAFEQPDYAGIERRTCALRK